MPLSAAILQTLQSIVGDKGFITNQAEIAPYLVESRNKFKGQCDVLIKPASAQEVAEVLAICNDHDVAVVPQGGNTGHCGGAVPNGGILLNLSRLNKIRQIDPLNATITVDAGCILQTIQEAAEKAGLFFPLSLAAQGSCQIGGNLATNAGGVHVLRYGNMRDLTLGLEVALPDGRLWDGLRALRKDNTGYDLKHLFIGSEGTLGVITGAVLKLSAKPKDTAVAFLGAETPHDLMEVFAILRDQFGEELSAFEIMPRFGLEMVTKHMKAARDPFHAPYHWYGVVEVASSRPDSQLTTALEEALHPLFDKGFLHNASVAKDLSQASQFWALRENMSEAQKCEGGSIKHDVSVPLSHIAEFLEETSHMIGNIVPNSRICAFGHVGDGNIHFNISQPIDMEKDAFLAHWSDFNEIVHEMAEKYGGSFSAEHGIGLLKTNEMELFREGPELDMMHSIKNSLDPNNIMNPGKILKKRP
ncbi:FAD/FMN-dependent dehydrogenase [Candidatus Terasakiella magnetica]|uniref:FAD/FMN-dependent dehydrogenase n=1 Tax=Candidatus Terasakiella magnetica TaxID=1867952 RepID=A0A1C3RI43_9PROT|nr:FAD-binding oxidoreductase [Candidatus Terasakiella magnetica]SCA56963.1 FAD/FMN-dependent dehydrogenase [Candidatus Terasakiella magnetica]